MTTGVHSDTRLAASARRAVHHTRCAAHAVHVHHTAARRRTCRYRNHHRTAACASPPRTTHTCSTRATHVRPVRSHSRTVSVRDTLALTHYTRLDTHRLDATGAALARTHHNAAVSQHAVDRATSTAWSTQLTAAAERSARAPRRRRPHRRACGARKSIARTHRAWLRHARAVALAGIDHCHVPCRRVCRDALCTRADRHTQRHCRAVVTRR